jgi:hypothetical protein
MPSNGLENPARPRPALLACAERSGALLALPALGSSNRPPSCHLRFQESGGLHRSPYTGPEGRPLRPEACPERSRRGSHAHRHPHAMLRSAQHDRRQNRSVPSGGPSPLAGGPMLIANRGLGELTNVSTR